MMPVVNRLDNVHAEAQIYKLNVGTEYPENRALQQEFGLRGHPTFVVLDANDVVAGTFYGVVPETELSQTLAAAIGK